MMLKNKRENIIYLIILSIVMLLPVFTLQGGRDFSQTRVYMEWIRLIPFLLIFIVNNYILVPKLLLPKKTLLYMLCVTLLIFGVVIVSPYLKFLQNLVFEWQQQMPNQLPPRRGRSPEYNMASKILIFFLVVGFNNAITLLFRREKEEKIQEQKDKIHLQTELSFLRNQISPHFFMNTLNNIHALIKFDANQAQKSVIQLSTLMRYLLNESKSGKATIKDEFEFLKSYIDLMRIRCSQRVEINIDLDVEDNSTMIPSLLFISLVENAFKYGIDYSKRSFISVKASTENDELFFEVRNSKATQTDVTTKTGVGLVNLEKQLVLLYKSNYSFNIIESETEYTAKLKIPLNDDKVHSH